MKLITDAGNQHTLKALVAAKLAGVNVECKIVNSTGKLNPLKDYNQCCQKVEAAIVSQVSILLQSDCNIARYTHRFVHVPVHDQCFSTDHVLSRITLTRARRVVPN